MSQQLILGTAGHIDHGKTKLVRALTGIDTDRLPEEKARGLTIDIGFAVLDLGEYELGIVDVPGHERFIKNMLAGASGVDVVLLVVAADDSVMPQTREHLALLELLDARHGLVAISKCALVEREWLDLVEQDVRGLVSGTFLDGAPMVRTDALKGDGLEELKTAIKGVCDRVKPAPAGSLFRLAVDRSFNVTGRGTVVTGTVWSGRAAVDDEVEWLPPGKRVRIRGLESHGRPVPEVVRGQRAAIALSGVHHGEIHRGHELATPGYLAPTRLLTAELRVLETSPWPVRHRARLRLHAGTRESVATVSLAGQKLVHPGQTATVQFHLTEPAAAVCGQPYVVRSESPLLTLGGGHVLQPLARPNRRRRDRIEFDRLRAPEQSTRAAAAIEDYGCRTWTHLDLCRDAQLDLPQASAVVDELASSGTVVHLPVTPVLTLCLHRAVLGDLEGRVLKTIERHHEMHPLRAAVPREQLAGPLRHFMDDRVLAALIHRLIDAGRLVGDARTVALADFKARLSDDELELKQRVVSAYQSAGFSPPDPGALIRHDDKALRQILDLCVAEGHLVHIGGTVYLHTERERQLRDRVGALLGRSGGATVSEIKDDLGTSRKFAVPFCEYLDRIGCTKRRGDRRVPA